MLLRTPGAGDQVSLCSPTLLSQPRTRAPCRKPIPATTEQSELSYRRWCGYGRQQPWSPKAVASAASRRARSPRGRGRTWAANYTRRDTASKTPRSGRARLVPPPERAILAAPGASAAISRPGTSRAPARTAACQAARRSGSGFGCRAATAARTAVVARPSDARTARNGARAAVGRPRARLRRPRRTRTLRLTSRAPPSRKTRTQRGKVLAEFPSVEIQASRRSALGRFAPL